MLPDTIHKLSREERFSYARLLAFMARVDNELTVDEMAMFEQRLGTALLSTNQRELIRQALKTPPPLDECLAGLSEDCLLYTSPSPRDRLKSRMPSSA